MIIANRAFPPSIGEHNLEIYRDELGLSEREMAELTHTGII